MSTAVARRASTKVARPLKILIPLIRQDLERGDRAGMESYASAGDKLLEARSQVTHGYWGTWLSKNFHLSGQTARAYMRYAELRAADQNECGTFEMPRSLSEMTGQAKWHREKKAAERPFRSVLKDLDTDVYAQEKQTRDEEVRLHREIALELVDIGFKALATRLHPDRGGSKEAMTRLNRVRDDLKGLAQSRRFV